jgi:hypothetical protein
VFLAHWPDLLEELRRFENFPNVETTGYFLLQDRRAEWDYSDSGGTANSQIDLRKKGQVDHDDDRLALVAVTAID